MRRMSVLVTVMSVVILALAASVASAQGTLPDPGPPSGNGVQPYVVPDNSNCAQLNPDFEELRVNAPADGTFTDGTLSVTIDVRNTASGPVFDWTSNLGVDAVVVKGGDDGNAFVYDPPSESKGDTGLHSPVNPNNNQFFGLSHISFCYDITPSIKVEKSGNTLS